MPTCSNTNTSTFWTHWATNQTAWLGRRFGARLDDVIDDRLPGMDAVVTCSPHLDSRILPTCDLLAACGVANSPAASATLSSGGPVLAAGVCAAAPGRGPSAATPGVASPGVVMRDRRERPLPCLLAVPSTAAAGVRTKRSMARCAACLTGSCQHDGEPPDAVLHG